MTRPLDVLRNVNTSLGRICIIRTPDGPLTLPRLAAEQLLHEGVISGDIRGELHASDAAIVKTAMMSRWVCDFCASRGAVNSIDVPDFDMPDDAGRSTDGWAACDACYPLVLAKNKKALFQRALDSASFPKFTRLSLKELHERFWRSLAERDVALGIAKGIGDFVEDRIPQGAVTLKARDKRVEAMKRIADLTPDEVEDIVRGDVSVSAMTKIAAWKRRMGDPVDPARFEDLLASEDVKKPPVVAGIPHWQRALDAKFDAMQLLSMTLTHDERFVLTSDVATDLNNPQQLRDAVMRATRVREMSALGYKTDVKALRVAETYSFNGETAAAIQEAARSIPHDAPLSSIETPNTGAGWFWFAEPIRTPSASIASDVTNALLWSWVESNVETGDEASLRFSTFIEDQKTPLRGRIVPSTKWHWPVSMTFVEMLEYNRQLYRRDFWPSGQYSMQGMNIMPENETLRVIHEFSLFFLMACVWFKQTVPILTRAPGHIERHARKRYVRDHKLSAPPTVQVIALRKSQRTPSADAPVERREGVREYHCRWIVKGHARMQACGPMRKDRKLIWIDAHPAGPEDKPLRTRQRVHAVVR